MQPYYDDGQGIVIYHGDCREVLPTLPAVDLVLTDPPYGVGKADWDGSFPSDWMPAAAALTPVLAVMPGVANLLHLPARIGDLDYRWVLSVRIVNGMTRGAFGFGNWIPCVVYAQRGVSVCVLEQDAGEVSTDTTRKTMPDHPSPKPLRAMRWMIERFPKAQTILDPFMGSGTTLRAAKDLGRKAIGIEIEERYCEIAALRLQQEVFQLAEAS